MTEQLTQEQRDNYIDTSRHNAKEVLGIPEVERRLGGYASELFTLTNSVVPATVKDGEVFTDKSNSRQIPATTLSAGENATRVALPDPFDTFQIETMQRKFGDVKTQEMIQGFNRASVPLFVFGKELAHMHTQDAKNADNTTKWKGRPMVTFNYDRSLQPYVDAPVWFHELYHVKQARELPFWNRAEIDFDSQELSWELEGYAVSVMTILGIQDAGRQADLLASIPPDSLERTLEIDAIRERVNRYETDPYAATHTVASELIHNGHGITKFLSDQITRK